MATEKHIISYFPQEPLTCPILKAKIVRISKESSFKLRGCENILDREVQADVHPWESRKTRYLFYQMKSRATLNVIITLSNLHNIHPFTITARLCSVLQIFFATSIASAIAMKYDFQVHVH